MYAVKHGMCTCCLVTMVVGKKLQWIKKNKIKFQIYADVNTICSNLTPVDVTQRILH